MLQRTALLALLAALAFAPTAVAQDKKVFIRNKPDPSNPTVSTTPPPPPEDCEFLPAVGVTCRPAIEKKIKMKGQGGNTGGKPAEQAVKASAMTEERSR